VNDPNAPAAAYLVELPSQFDLVAHLERQRAFSFRTFGPGARTKGVVDHIRRELTEVEKSPADLMEWVDVILLALDGAWRAGHEPAAIAAGIAAKQARNEGRQWPDWRTADPDKAIEHVRTDGGER
jgi:protein-tyrosine-phosphatase